MIVQWKYKIGGDLKYSTTFTSASNELFTESLSSCVWCVMIGDSSRYHLLSRNELLYLILTIFFFRIVPLSHDIPFDEALQANVAGDDFYARNHTIVAMNQQLEIQIH